MDGDQTERYLKDLSTNLVKMQKHRMGMLSFGNAMAPFETWMSTWSGAALPGTFDDDLARVVASQQFLQRQFTEFIPALARTISELQTANNVGSPSRRLETRQGALDAIGALTTSIKAHKATSTSIRDALAKMKPSARSCPWNAIPAIVDEIHQELSTNKKEITDLTTKVGKLDGELSKARTGYTATSTGLQSALGKLAVALNLDTPGASMPLMITAAQNVAEVVQDGLKEIYEALEPDEAKRSPHVTLDIVKTAASTIEARIKEASDAHTLVSNSIREAYNGTLPEAASHRVPLNVLPSESASTASLSEALQQRVQASQASDRKSTAALDKLTKRASALQAQVESSTAIAEDVENKMQEYSLLLPNTSAQRTLHDMLKSIRAGFSVVGTSVQSFLDTLSGASTTLNAIVIRPTPLDRRLDDIKTELLSFITRTQAIVRSVAQPPSEYSENRAAIDREIRPKDIGNLTSVDQDVFKAVTVLPQVIRERDSADSSRYSMATAKLKHHSEITAEVVKLLFDFMTIMQGKNFSSQDSSSSRANVAITADNVISFMKNQVQPVLLTLTSQANASSSSRRNAAIEAKTNEELMESARTAMRETRDSLVRWGVISTQTKARHTIEQWAHDVTDGVNELIEVVLSILKRIRDLAPLRVIQPSSGWTMATIDRAVTDVLGELDSRMGDVVNNALSLDDAEGLRESKADPDLRITPPPPMSNDKTDMATNLRRVASLMESTRNVCHARYEAMQARIATNSNATKNMSTMLLQMRRRIVPLVSTTFDTAPLDNIRDLEAKLSEFDHNVLLPFVASYNEKSGLARTKQAEVNTIGQELRSSQSAVKRKQEELERQESDIARARLNEAQVSAENQRLRRIVQDLDGVAVKKTLDDFAYLEKLIKDRVKSKGASLQVVSVVSALIELANHVDKVLNTDGDLVKAMARVRSRVTVEFDPDGTHKRILLDADPEKLDAFYEFCICAGVPMPNLQVTQPAPAGPPAELSVCFDPTMRSAIESAFTGVRLTAQSSFLFSTDKVRDEWLRVIAEVVNAIAPPTKAVGAAKSDHMRVATESITAALARVINSNNFVGFELTSALASLRVPNLARPLGSEDIASIVVRAAAVQELLQRTRSTARRSEELDELKTALSSLQNEMTAAPLMWPTTSLSAVTSALDDLRVNAATPLAVLVDAMDAVLTPAFGPGTAEAFLADASRRSLEPLLTIAPIARKTVADVFEVIKKLETSRIENNDTDVEYLARQITVNDSPLARRIAMSLSTATTPSRPRVSWHLAEARIATHLSHAASPDAVDKVLAETVRTIFEDGPTAVETLVQVLVAVKKFTPPNARVADIKAAMNALVGAAPLMGQLEAAITRLPSAYENSAFFGGVVKDTQKRDYLVRLAGAASNYQLQGDVGNLLSTLVRMLSLALNTDALPANAPLPAPPPVSVPLLNAAQSAAAATSSGAGSVSAAVPASSVPATAPPAPPNAALATLIFTRFELFRNQIEARVPNSVVQHRRDRAAMVDRDIGDPFQSAWSAHFSHQHTNANPVKKQRIDAAGGVVDRTPEMALRLAEIEHTEVDAVQDEVKASVSRVSSLLDTAIEPLQKVVESGNAMLGRYASNQDNVLAARYAGGPANAVADVTSLVRAMQGLSTNVAVASRAIASAKAALEMPDAFDGLRTISKRAKKTGARTSDVIELYFHSVATQQLMLKLTPRVQSAYNTVIYLMQSMPNCEWARFPFLYHLMSDSLVVPLATLIAMQIFAMENPNVAMSATFEGNRSAAIAVLCSIGLSPFGRAQAGSVESEAQIPDEAMTANEKAVDPFLRPRLSLFSSGRGI